MKKKKEPAVRWQVKAYLGRELHALPVDDGFKHIARQQCLCEPTLEGEKDGHRLYVHHVRDLAN